MTFPLTTDPGTIVASIALGSQIPTRPILTRSYYFYRERFDAEAWAIGSALSYRSGRLFHRFGMGAALYTAERLYGPEDRDGTLLLKPSQHGYTVLGQIYGKMKIFEEHFLNFYQFSE